MKTDTKGRKYFSTKLAGRTRSLFTMREYRKKIVLILYERVSEGN